jgi:hypothetical protein
MKNLVLLLFVLITSATFAQKQKVTVDDDTVKVDGVPYCLLVKGPGMSYDFTVKSLTGEELMFMQFLEFNNPNKVNNSNPKGRVTYFEVTFFNDSRKCEVDAPGGKKFVAKIIVDNKLIKDNAIDPAAENKFILINGFKYSEEKKTLGGTVIIINN